MIDQRFVFVTPSDEKIVFAPSQTGPPAIAKRQTSNAVLCCQSSSCPRRTLPAPLHDRLRLKKMSKSLLWGKKLRSDGPRFGICSRGVAEAPARSSARAKHAQLTPRTFHRVRIHVHPSRALSRPPSASVPSTTGLFPTVRPGSRIASPANARASLVAPFLSRARSNAANNYPPRFSLARSHVRELSRACAVGFSLSERPTWRGG